MLVEPGYYKHFKGNIYEVIGNAKHSETGEEMVVYKGLYHGPHGYGAMWVRPGSMFLETIERDGKRMERFMFISEEDARKELEKV